MNILAIETSCDETGVCLLSATGTFPESEIIVHANELATQISAHQEYGGVFPSLAKRLHAENLPVILEKILCETDTQSVGKITKDKKAKISEWLKRHDGLAEKLLNIFEAEGLPDLTAVAVTIGPGLEPALWVGINMARSLALILDIPVIPVNHMEGHLLSALVDDQELETGVFTVEKPALPAVALLVSGGHTELIHVKDWGSYEKIGQTRDDAAGEAFDKVGRLLGLPYPAGPHVSALAETAEDSGDFSLPRPMIDSVDLDFSFSGLKTAAARKLAESKPLKDVEKAQFAHELETAIVDVLIQKSNRAIKKVGAKTLLVGGGVSANQKLRRRLREIEGVTICLSPRDLAGDNAVMIGLAGLANYHAGSSPLSDISAESRLSL